MYDKKYIYNPIHGNRPIRLIMVHIKAVFVGPIYSATVPLFHVRAVSYGPLYGVLYFYAALFLRMNLSPNF